MLVKYRRRDSRGEELSEFHAALDWPIIVRAIAEYHLSCALFVPLPSLHDFMTLARHIFSFAAHAMLLISYRIVCDDYASFGGVASDRGASGCALGADIDRCRFAGSFIFAKPNEIVIDLPRVQPPSRLPITFSDRCGCP